jgi:translation initiation factor IF-1
MKKYKKKEKEVEVIDSKDFVEIIGEVVELMPASSFKVLLPNGHEILTHLSGKMRMNRIRLLPGDRVKVQMSPYDLTKGRITFRM